MLHLARVRPSPPIVIRDLKFDSTPALARWYMGGDPFATSFFNALSASFPTGEKFFIDSVRPFREGAPAKLKNEIADFIKQEALHTREHAAFNTQIEAGGYDVAELYVRTKREVDRMRRRSATAQLGCTMAVEHFTALFAHQLLAAPHHLRSAPAETRAMWRWHALEEIEHKAVAFDTFEFASRKWSPLRRWIFRSAVMVESTWLFLRLISGNMNSLHRQDGLPWLAAWAKTAIYLFGPGGVLRAMTPGWLSWFKIGFHPWALNDRNLAADAALDYGPPRFGGEMTRP